MLLGGPLHIVSVALSTINHDTLIILGYNTHRGHSSASSSKSSLTAKDLIFSKKYHTTIFGLVLVTRAHLCM